MKLIFLTAVNREMQPLLKKNSIYKKTNLISENLFHANISSNEIYFFITGMGEENIYKYLPAVLERVKPDIVFSLGLCAGLSSERIQNDIVILDQIFDERRRELIELSFKKDFKHIIEMLDRIGETYFIESGISVSRIISSPAEKKNLYTKHPVSVADMESYSIAEICRKKNLSLVCLRLVFDAWDEELPDTQFLLNERGNMIWTRLISYLIMQPKNIFDLIQLSKKMSYYDQKIKIVIHKLLINFNSSNTGGLNE